MNIRTMFKGLLVSVIIMVFAVSAFAAGTVSFFNGGTKITGPIKSSAITELKLKAALPKAIGSIKFDVLSVVIQLSHLDVSGNKDYAPGDLDSGTKSIDMTLLSANGNSDFSGYTIRDFADVPAEKDLATMTCKIKVVAFKIVGHKSSTTWDEYSSSWITKDIPIYDKGNVLSEGTLTVIPEKSNKLLSEVGRIAFPLDKGFTGDRVNVSDMGGDKVYAGIYLEQKKDANFPWDFKFTAFTSKISNLGASFQADPIAAIKADMAVWASGERGKMSVFKMIAFSSNLDKSWTIGPWTPVTIGGVQGEKAMISGNGGNFPPDDITWVYLVKYDTFVVISYVNFGNETDLSGYPYARYNSGLSADQRAAYEAEFDKMAGLLQLSK